MVSPMTPNEQDLPDDRQRNLPRSLEGWTGLQRREGPNFLLWLNREKRLKRGVDALAKALRSTLDHHVQTASDARCVWEAVPAVLEKCNHPDTYRMPHAEAAYAWLHLLDRYVRTWLALEHLVGESLLPMGRFGVRALDVGTGPGPSALATHDFFTATEDYAQSSGNEKWRQPPHVRCVEPVPAMNRFRHWLAEMMFQGGAPRSVFTVGNAESDFGAIHPRFERRELESHLRNRYEEYYDEQWDQWHEDPVYTAEEASLEANVHRRYRLFTFSNFLTTLDTVSTFKANFEEILTDARPGSVLLLIGAKGGDYPDIYERLASLAEAGGFRRRNDPAEVGVHDTELDARLAEEARWFYHRLEDLAGSSAADAEALVGLRAEFDGDQPIRYRRSAVHAFRK